MLPELGDLRNNDNSTKAVAKDAVQIFVTDTVWGRKKALFEATC